jgi:ParB family chromosome partitioning protein
MAKRKRLTSAALVGQPPEPDTEDLSPTTNHTLRRVPIAQVAGEAAATAALEELAGEMKTARTQGRLVQSLPLGAIKADHLIRDRMLHDAEEMAVLKASIAARGQQTPVEVVELSGGAYGLISGHRRLTALQLLLVETGDDRFGQVLALIKPLDSAATSYTAMVEENEIRANLSFYERARLAAEAAKIGVYPTPARAVATLFANSPAPKRSKITAFLIVHERIGSVLKYPTQIPEKLGLALSKALEGEVGFETRLKAALRKAPDRDAAQERAVLERSMKGPAAPGPTARQITAGITLEAHRGKVVLKGKDVTEDMVRDLERWLASRQ